MFKWQPLDKVPVNDLIQTREQVHHAVQLIAASGKYLIEERPDDSHTSMHWNENEEAFEGETIRGNPPSRIGFRPADFTLYIKHDERITATISLGNKTREQAFTWLTRQLEKAGIDVSKFSLQMHYEIPSTTFNENEPFFLGNKECLKTIETYYANANSLLKAIKEILPEANKIRCWPHHFDIATLYTIDKEGNSEDTPSIGIGLSPGDISYQEPYLYVTPSPYPEINDNTIPELSAGKWHTEGWVGAVLTADSIYSQNDQVQEVINYVNSALPACTDLLNHKL